MEDVLAVYQRPYDSRFPQVCLDEVSTQLLADTRRPQPPAPGRVAREDYEYIRHGVANVFLCCEPLRGWRSATVTERRTRVDWAQVIRDLVDVHYPTAERIVLVLDNLNTHTLGSLYEAFPPEEARRSGEAGAALHAQARELAKHGRDRTEHPAAAMSRPPHPGPGYADGGGRRLGSGPEHAQRHGELALHHRRCTDSAQASLPNSCVMKY